MNKEEFTLVLGASEKPDRYSNRAIRMLRDYGYATLAHGNKAGLVLDVPIERELPKAKCDTITLYLSAKNQSDFIAPILEMKPRRVIFNPGTENAEFEQMLEENGIEATRACTLVLLSTGQY
jgi:predicted CoA-binding protein